VEVLVSQIDISPEERHLHVDLARWLREGKS
jgi:hypothetical protein